MQVVTSRGWPGSLLHRPVTIGAFRCSPGAVLLPAALSASREPGTLTLSNKVGSDLGKAHKKRCLLLCSHRPLARPGLGSDPPPLRVLDTASLPRERNGPLPRALRAAADASRGSDAQSRAPRRGVVPSALAPLPRRPRPPSLGRDGTVCAGTGRAGWAQRGASCRTAITGCPPGTRTDRWRLP